MNPGAAAFSLEETFLDPPALEPPPTRRALLIFLVALAALLHLATLSWGDLRDGDEGLNAGGAREMLQTRSWLVPTADSIPQLADPPLLRWLILASYDVFGVNTGAARLPVALATIATVWLTFLLGERLMGYRRGFLAGLVYLCSAGTFLLGRRVTAEPVFAAFIAGVIYCGIRGFERRPGRRHWFAGCWICAAFAGMTSGAVGVLLPAAFFTVLAFFFREARVRFSALLQWPGIAIFVLLTVPWHLWLMWKFPGMNQEILAREWLQLIGRDNLVAMSGELSRGQFTLRHVAWWFPWSIAIVFEALCVWRKVLRPHALEFADAVPLCWMAVVLLPVVVFGPQGDASSMSMWSAFALWAVNAWDRMPRAARLAGTISIAVAGLASAGLAAAHKAMPLSAGLPSFFAITAVALLFFAGIAIYFVWQGRAGLALVSLSAAMLPVGFSGLDAAARNSAYFSLGGAARFLNQRMEARDKVFYEGSLRSGSSLVFYLDRAFFLVNQNPAVENLRVLDGRAQELFLDKLAVVKSWDGPARVYLILAAGRLEQWEKLLGKTRPGMHTVTTCGNAVVVSNRG